MKRRKEKQRMMDGLPVPTMKLCEANPQELSLGDEH
jgi:hypothetical protein